MPVQADKPISGRAQRCAELGDEQAYGARLDEETEPLGRGPGREMARQARRRRLEAVAV
jgi:hypothetical protein